MNGVASFVLPSFENTRYVEVKEGNMFGALDIIGSCKANGIPTSEWFNQK